jgi:O-antigen/teichoic acid export membrane protein
MLLIMCGYEKIHGYISLVSVLFNLTLNVILIKNYGALGAAIATAITATLTNISKVVLAKRKTGILTLPTFNI